VKLDDRSGLLADTRKGAPKHLVRRRRGVPAHESKLEGIVRKLLEEHARGGTWQDYDLAENAIGVALHRIERLYDKRFEEAVKQLEGRISRGGRVDEDDLMQCRSQWERPQE
jgi:hypothetical protein